jgi:hypothetical protein
VTGKWRGRITTSVRVQGTARLGPRRPEVTRPRQQSVTGGHDKRQRCSGHEPADRGACGREKKAAELVVVLARRDGAWKQGNSGDMELAPSAMAADALRRVRATQRRGRREAEWQMRALWYSGSPLHT